jgi:hypothetical protein
LTAHALVLAVTVSVPVALEAAEHPSLVKARALYNALDYDAAIAAARAARVDPASADAASLVAARAYLERYRLRTNDPADLAAAREALGIVRAAALTPRDQVDLLVGLGQALYLGNTFGAAAELFDNALGRVQLLPDRDRFLLLDWWATALDREAQMGGPDRRASLLRRVVTRMDEELQREPGSATANYWLAVATRGAGELERAWDAAIAAWVRAPIAPATAVTLRADIDQFVTMVLIPERARARPPREQTAATDALRAEWDLVKTTWK